MDHVNKGLEKILADSDVLEAELQEKLRTLEKKDIQNRSLLSSPSPT